MKHWISSSITSDSIKFVAALFILHSSLFPSAGAQDVSTVLVSAAEQLENAGGILATYDYRSEDGDGTGTFQYKNGKFVNDFGGQKIWYNGKTMWSLDKEYGEVTITTPTQGDVATVNPVWVLANYEKNYDASLGQQTKESMEVVLNAKKEKGPQIIRLRVTKGTYAPESIYMVLANGHALSISLNSYKTGQKFADSLFSFSEKDNPGVEINDLR